MVIHWTVIGSFVVHSGDCVIITLHTTRKRTVISLIRADHPLSGVRVRFPLWPTTLNQLSSQHCAVKWNTVSASVHLLPQDIRPANDLTVVKCLRGLSRPESSWNVFFFLINFFSMFSASSSLSSLPLRYSLSFSFSLSLSLAFGCWRLWQCCARL